MLLEQVPESRQDLLADFLAALFKLYVDLNFVYMEINPIVFVDGRVTPLDMAAKIDETASFLCGQKWGEIDFPAPFGTFTPLPDSPVLLLASFAVVRE